MLQHQDAVPGLTASVPVAERHLERDLDRGGAAIREADAGETCGCEPQQPARNLFCWLVRVAREDPLVEPPRLFGDHRRDERMAMARSEQRRVGTECVTTCQYRRCHYH